MRRPPPRSVAPTLPDEGLLVGWSLGDEPRETAFGFGASSPTGAATGHLEPIVHEGEGHLVTIAPTGAGKGIGCIIPALLRYRGPVVVIDPKGENYAVTARARREMGQRVIALDPFGVGVGRTAERGCLNPLDFLSPDSPTLTEDAEMIATTLMSSSGGGHRDPFWPHMGAQLLTLLLIYQLKRLPPEDWTLTKTRALLSRNPDEWQTFGNQLMEDPDPAIHDLAGLVVNPARATFGGYWAFSQMQTACFKGALIGDSIETSSFSLQELVDGAPLSLYVIIPPEKLAAYGNLLKTWLSVMIAALTHRHSRPERPTLFILDEAAQLGKMPQLQTAITLLRGYGVRVWTFWQDLSQIIGLYPDTWQTLLNNCHVQQFFGQSSRLGSNQAYDVTGLGSPEYLQTLDEGEMVLSRIGDQPVVARTPNYLHDPAFEGLYDENPFYQPISKAASQTARTTRVFRRSGATHDSKTGFHHNASFGRHLLEAQQFHPVAPSRWRPVEPDLATALLADLRANYEGLEDAPDDQVRFRCWPLTFYDQFDYFEIAVERPARREVCYFLRAPGEAVVLDGESTVIHALNARVGLKLRKSDVCDYLVFFCSSLDGDKGRFLIISDVEDLTFRIPPDDDYLDSVSAAIVRPTKPRKRKKNNTRKFRIDACVQYDDTLSRSSFTVRDDGTVRMRDERLLFGNMPILTDSVLMDYRLRLRPRQGPARQPVRRARAG